MAIETLLLTVGSDAHDRTDALTSAVVDVAGPTGATVVLLHVFAESEYEKTLERLEFDPADRPDPDRVAARHSTIQGLIDELDAAGIDHETRGATGDRGDSILATAEETTADMVFVGGRKRSPAGKAVFGSTAQQVMLNAPCPVTFVRSDMGV